MKNKRSVRHVDVRSAIIYAIIAVWLVFLFIVFVFITEACFNGHCQDWAGMI